MRVIVGLTGATGAVHATSLLARLRELGVETHLIVTDAGLVSAHHELGLDRKGLEALADVAHPNAAVWAPVASGSFEVHAMVVAPCSMRSLAAIAHGFGDNLLTRAADVTLKERRGLVLLAREAPLNLAHLRNMQVVTEMGGIVYPPLPAYYDKPATIADTISATTERVLALLKVPGAAPSVWGGLNKGAKA